MKKIALLLAIVLQGCTATRPLIDENKLKDDLNEAILEFHRAAGIPEDEAYRIK